MKITCPDCGKIIEVKGLGRKSLNIPVKNIYDALSKGLSIGSVAEKLGCSKAYIYGVLKSKKAVKVQTKISL